MRTILLSDYKVGDDRERIALALADAKCEPGSTVVFEPRVYTLTTERSREIRRAVMSGEYGADPEKVMFRPDFPYDRGIDLSGHDGTVLDGRGAHLLIDGFMEDISVRDCRSVTVRGFDIDNTVKPYTKAVAVSASGGVVKAVLSYPVTMATPVVRTAVYSCRRGRFIPEICDVDHLISVEGTDCYIALKGDASEVKAGDEIYLCHTFHFRPSVLIENAKDIKIEDVTVRSHSGMGMTAFHSANISLLRFRVIPSEGEHFSTNTDATHFTSCRGELTLTDCEFEGQGDDGINVHTYYYTPAEHDGSTVTLKIMSPTWTHTQKMDHPLPGDRFILTDKMSLGVKDTYKVLSFTCDEDSRACTVTLDRDLPDDLSGMLFADPDETPYLKVYNSHFRNHFARGMTLKAERCLVDGCDMTDLFELPVKLAAEAYWHEGVACATATFRNCRFINCGRLKYCVPRFECGGIEVFSDSREHTTTHGDVTIEGNCIECPECAHAVMLRDVKTVHMKDNVMISGKEPLAADPSVKMVKNNG